MYIELHQIWENMRYSSELIMLVLVFTALHGMQTQSSGEKASVRLSVRLSVKHVNCDKTEERCVQIFIPYERSFGLVF